MLLRQQMPSPQPYERLHERVRFYLSQSRYDADVRREWPVHQRMRLRQLMRRLLSLQWLS
jgi:hypothetical protein